jgi:hypothetical protein
MYLPVEVSHVERGNISKFAKLYPEGKILAAPAGSIGRGINMLNAKNIAAFGAILFIVRSLMPPHDPVNHARSLMHWLQNRIDDNRILPSGFGPAAEELRHQASQKWRELVTETSTWTDMTDESRIALSATVFTQIWQAVGRGIRGGVPVIVAFIDEKWAPKSARRKGGDTEETSLFLSMLSCYQGYLEGNEGSIYDQKLACALYREPIEALKNIEGMDISEILE